MGERLTDEQLDMACLAPDDDADPYPASLVRCLAHELRERRSAVVMVTGEGDGTIRRVYLTSDEVEALRDLRSRVSHIHPWSPLHSAALKVLERLLEGAK